MRRGKHFNQTELFWSVLPSPTNGLSMEEELWLSLAREEAIAMLVGALMPKAVYLPSGVLPSAVGLFFRLKASLTLSRWPRVTPIIWRSLATDLRSLMRR